MKPNFWQIPPVNQDILGVLPERITVLDNRLTMITQRFDSVVMASSLAAEDMIISDRIAALMLPIRVITLNTGKLHEETVALIDAVRNQLGIVIDVFSPNIQAAHEIERQYGSGMMYDSVLLRKKCCYIRKIEPLNRALSGAKAWITGQRRQQSMTRQELQFEEYDDARQMAKFNPIFDWTNDEIWTYVQTHHVPINTLYYQGYSSIGCEPCTRPVKNDEDIRAGRWWWEQQDSKECGLHV